MTAESAEEVERVEAWRSRDGKLFEERVDALAHDASVELRAAEVALGDLAEAMMSNREMLDAGDVEAALKHRAEQVRDACARFVNAKADHDRKVGP